MLKKEAINLRENGYSYGIISEKLTVSKSTLSIWLSKIPYKPNNETILRIGKARAASGAAKSALKIISTKRALTQAKKDIGRISKRDLFMLGIGLYMGEGSKNWDIIRVTNSDSRIISLVIRWFKVICGMSESNFKIRIHLYPDSNTEESIRFWSKETGLPLGQFQKSQVDYRKGKKKNKIGKLPFGTAHLTIQSGGKKEWGVFLSRRVAGWMEIVLKNAGIV